MTQHHRMLLRQESTHGLGIHSEGDEDEEDFSDEEGHHRPHHYSEHHPRHHQLHVPETAHSRDDGDISKSTSGISFGSIRDKKTVAEKLQAAFGYDEVEDFIGGNT